MVTINKVFILLSTLPVAIGNALITLKVLLINECLSIFCSWSNWREKKGLFWMEKHGKASLICGVNTNYYNSVHRSIPGRENSKHPRNFQSKSVSSAFIWVFRYILFLAKSREKVRLFFKDPKLEATL